MEESNAQNAHISSSSTSTSHQVQEEEEENEVIFRDNDPNNNQQVHQNHHQLVLQSSNSAVSNYHVNISIFDTSRIHRREEVFSCLILLIFFWLLASMVMMLGYFGSVNLQLGPNCSRLVKINTFFVQTIKAQAMDEEKPGGAVLYGFYEPPPLDVETHWVERHNAVLSSDFHKEWVYFLNKGSKLDIIYRVKSSISSPLSLVIAQGRESLVMWLRNPSYPNTTLSWNIINGSGKIQQEIGASANYYIAVGNLNSEKVAVEFKFKVKTFIYNTSKAYYRCSLGNHLCSLQLFLLGTTAAVLTSPPPKEGGLDDDWLVQLSYGPRWIIYIVGSGLMSILIMLVLKQINQFDASRTDHENQAVVPFLAPKDDTLSWGSSYDSISNDELDDMEECFSVKNPTPLCVICFEAPRESFFLPCGHSVACFTCGTSIAEEAGNCPVCQRTMKKVKKIFTV